MKAVIIAAGSGIRLRPLTLTKPKPLIEIAGRPIIDRIVSALPSEIDELVVVVGYLGDQLINHCGRNFFGRQVTYVWQKEQLGTGDALLTCRTQLGKEKFLVLNGDDLLGGEGLRRCLRYDFCLLVSQHAEPSRFGVVILNEDGSLREIIEKPVRPAGNLVSTGVWLFDERIFEEKYRPDREPNGQYYLTNMASKLTRNHKINIEEADFWQPITTPADLPLAEAACVKIKAVIA